MACSKTTIEPPDYFFIPGGLNVGAQIIVRGRVGVNQDRFHIDLQNKQADGGDIAFVFNPWTVQKKVVRNSFSKGSWQNEELGIPFFPFTAGSKFTIRLFVGPESYVVLVNCQYFIEFKHRLPYKDVRYLKLSEGAEYYEATCQNPSCAPYFGEFPGGLKEGNAVRVRGVASEYANRFAINFNVDAAGEQIGLHFNPRPPEGDAVLNTKMGSWQAAERGQGWCPFGWREFFEVLFIANKDRFNVYVNNKFFTSYVYRIPRADIKYLNINGDVTLMDGVFTDPMPNPHVKVIPSGLEDSDLVVTKGYFYPEGKRFEINLINGTSLSDDIALVVNPRRDQNVVVLNSRKNGIWQKEERHSLPSLFSDKIPFEVEIVAKCNKFKIYINGLKLADFMTRGKVDGIKSVGVIGEAYIYEIKLLRRVDTPFVDRLPGSLKPGSWITVIGTPKKNANCFAINLQCSDKPSYGQDVAFHFNPRLNIQDSVRNTMINGSWGPEEREEPCFPFKPEDQFEVTILRLPYLFRVFVNRKFYIDYTHRIDPGQVSHVMLMGDCNFFEPEFY